MKKLLLLAVSACFITLVSMAQDQKDMKKDAKYWDNKIKTELSLTPEQVTKFDAVSLEYGDKMESLKKDATLSDDARKEKKMQLKKEKQAKLFEFFTPEQQTKYSELMEKKKSAKPAQ
jgi:Spy/CpxP family protein refolding chaperone